MFISDCEFHSFIECKKVYLSPYNDLSLNLKGKIAEQYNCIFSGYIDAKKEHSNVYRSSVIRKDDVVIISSPAYWNDIANSISLAKIYINTKHGFVEYQKYKQAIAGKIYSELCVRFVDKSSLSFVNEVLRLLKNKFHTIAVISNNRALPEGDFIIWEEDYINYRECFLSLSIDSMAHERSLCNLSVLFSKEKDEMPIALSIDDNVSYTNIICFDGAYPFRSTLTRNEDIYVGYSSVEELVAAQLIEKDISILTDEPHIKYIDLIDSSRFGIPYKYLSPNKYYHYNDLEETDTWQLEVYLFALGLMVKNDFSSIADIGCGSAYKLMTYFKSYNTLGIELPENVAVLRNKYPNRTWLETDFIPRNQFSCDIIVFSDVIEHLPNPDDAIEYIKQQNFKYLVLSTPAKDFLYKNNDPFFYGPPKNPAHQREWTMNEFSNYIGNHFNIIDHRLSSYNQSTQMLICEKK
ncbi:MULTISPECIES: class I SAM-dependent methyltransferase [Aeromonas]|uniref:class I SAM-dependent methyltransferase n=1 Tax=Aeromonas TaxID=642 RepID=UPI00188E3548|nr:MULTISPECIES: class I SAM-dependent methyltransferase [Aeromonas]MBF4798270.1 class I SAM-dependent methyltransferase [Aeromonas hydrophila]UXB13924.1 class I SAM-dependent methyltransferase [Aeromonas dhakensis]